MTMGRLHRDRRGNAAYIGRETLPSFFCIPFYRTRRATTAGSSGEADLLLLLLLVLGGSNLFSTRSTNPLLLFSENSSLSTISQRLTTSPSQGWAYRGYGRRVSQQYASFPSFSWRLRSSNFPPSPCRNANRFPPFEARLVLRKTIYDPNIVQRLALQTKRTKNLGSIEIIPDYLRIIYIRLWLVFLDENWRRK